jgi:ketosteroid isomerase-like protein
MKNYLSTQFAVRTARTAISLLLGAVFFLACAAPAGAQKKKKNEPPPAENKPVIPTGDEQQIDYMISEMLGAWQLGDIERLRKAYADDVAIVNGIWAPPVFTWTNYLAVFQAQHARMQQVRMDRSNTYIKLSGNFGWACYQWDFSAVVDGQPSAARGQTTLIVEKRNDRWVIVHNHTSLAPTAQPISPANTPQIAQPQPNNPSAH